jgi:hypothetical protein
MDSKQLNHAASSAVLPHWMRSITFGSFATSNAAPVLAEDDGGPGVRLRKAKRKGKITG